MSTASTERSTKDTSQGGGRRMVTPVSSLPALVGAHPDALEEIYRAGRPADPAELGDTTRGYLLATMAGTDVFLLLRPVIRALASDLFPWRGKTFDHGGNSGKNLVFGKQAFRFHTEVGPSRVDGRPTLHLDYSLAAYDNPWPVRAIKDELRAVGPGVAIGPAYYDRGESQTLLLWFGLTRSDA